MDGPPPVLMIHKDRAWLCRGDWHREVDANEFLAWAAYSGVTLDAFPDGPSQLVHLETRHHGWLFDMKWRL